MVPEDLIAERLDAAIDESRRLRAACAENIAEAKRLQEALRDNLTEVALLSRARPRLE